MTKQDTDNHYTGLEIAVVGMAGRFPGAENIAQFWENIEKGVESVSFFSEEELIEAGIDSNIIGNPDYVKAKGIIDDIEYFDASFFNYSPREAAVMDPQIRIMHECAWEALENAGYNSKSYDGLIGLYAGASANFNWVSRSPLIYESSNSEGLEVGTYCYKDSLSTLVSYKLNLKGPSFTIYTACSTSLVAVHLACRGLLTGECSIALAGGVSISFPKKNGYIYQPGMVTSPDGHCRSFDAKAQGSVFSDGIGIVALKRLEDAISDGDTIHAVIKSSAINNDGSRRAGYMAPSIEGQSEVIRTALHMAEVDIESIGYIEAHGTGTSVGDPIEIEALKHVFHTSSSKFCCIGTVKTNIGHLDVASGVAGLIKAILAIKQRKIPPILHFEKLNPSIDLDNSPFYINTELKEWKNEKYPLRAGVSSFGLGGTNAHVILEEAPKQKQFPASKKNKLIMLSARAQSALNKLEENLLNFLENNRNINIEDLAYTLQIGREQFNHRKVFVCSNIQETIDAIKFQEPDKSTTCFSSNRNTPVVFMFPGQGAQYINMGLEIYHTEPVFRAEMDKCFDIHDSIAGYKLRDILFPSYGKGDADDKINNTSITQPAVFIIEYSLVKLLMHWGINPSAMIGYSFGEYVAACISGVFSLQDAISLIILRGQLMEEMPKGAMLSVPMSEKELLPLLGKNISLAVVNGPSCIISGTIKDMEEFELTMKKKKILCMSVNSAHAGHSAIMDSALGRFEKAVKSVVLSKPAIPYISCITGQWITQENATDPMYWVRHMRETVRFSEGITKLSKEINGVFIEVGPGRDLTVLSKRHVQEDKTDLFVNLFQPSNKKIAEDRYFLRQIGKLWTYGVNIQWTKFYSGVTRCRIPLPTYPFEGQYYWLDEKKVALARNGISENDTKKRDLSRWFYVPTWKQSQHIPKIPSEQDKDAYWLVLVDKCKFGMRLISLLRHHGYKIITVSLGKKYEKVNDNVYTSTINDSDYETLFKELKEQKIVIKKIIHLLGLEDNYEASFDFQQTNKHQDIGYFSLLNLARAIRRFNFSYDINIEVITSCIYDVIGNEEICPEKATISGPCKVIPQEYSNLHCRNIDITLPEIDSEEEIKLFNQILTEFLTVGRETIIAYRNGYRWVQFFEPITLNELNCSSSKLKEGGTYLITGGLGGVGVTIAEYLIRCFQAKVALVGRTRLPQRDKWQEYLEANKEDDISEKIRKAIFLESLGGKVLVINADVSNYHDMEDMLYRVENTLGRINGIIHAAGIVGSDTLELIDNISLSNCESQFKSKIDGVLVLQKLFKDKDIDFCLLMSSISSVLGGIGNVAYTAANAFMDSFVYKCNKGNSVQWLAVDWDGWAVKEFDQEDNVWVLNWKKTAMTANEAIKVLNYVLSSGVGPRIVNSTIDLDERIKQWIRLKPVCENTEIRNSYVPASFSRQNLTTPYIAPRNKIEEAVSDMFQNIFGFEQIGVQDDFLELGGDSLKAITLIAMIKKELNTDIPLKEFFKHSTVEWIAEYINSRKVSGVQGNRYLPIKKVESKECYVLSSAQKRMFILHHMDVNSTIYNNKIVKLIEGDIDEEKMEDTFKKLIERHESLRTSFWLIDDIPVQKVQTDVELHIEYYGYISRKEDLEQIIKDFSRPFDLTKAPLFRVGLINLDENKCIVIVDIHHIISDIISMDLFFKDFLAIYDDNRLPELQIQYKDYAEWQNSKENHELITGQKSYWMEKLNGELPVLNLPTDYIRPKVKSNEGRRIYFDIESDKVNAIRVFSKEHNVTVFVTLLAAFYVLLYKMTDQEDIIVGTPVVGRNQSELYDTIGLFVNTLALRNNISGEKIINEFLDELMNTSLEAFENQEYQFDDIVEAIAIQRDISRNPIFDVMFNLIHEKESITDVKANINMHSFQDYSNSTSKFDISITVRELENSFKFEFEYCSRLFKNETIERFIEYYKTIISNILENPDQKVSQLQVMSEQEKGAIVYKFNNTRADYPEDITVCKMFEMQAEKTPDKYALICEGNKMTYKELNEKSNNIAWLLIKEGIKRGDIVGLVAKCSIETVIAIIGILKSGAAYLPIDSEYPNERIRSIVKDSKISILLSTEEMSRDFYPSCKVVNVMDKSLYNNKEINPFNQSTANDLAYVIYTSGSTGRPKGVMITNKSLTNYIWWANKVYVKGEEVRFPLYSSLSFDLTVTSIFTPLISGNTIMIYSGGSKDFVIKHILEDNKVEVMKLTPTHLQIVKELGITTSNIKRFIVGGEDLKVTLAKEISSLYENNIEIYNEYGPTEATIGCMIYKYDALNNFGTSVPIGVPADNVCIYILDKYLNPVPKGIIGEIYISGDGIAKGYLNRVELTEERFIQNPFDLNKVMYKTGDIGRMLENSNVEFVGRIDNQVKIRGYRIELEEITSHLLKHPRIKDAVVVVRSFNTINQSNDELGDKYLCAYVIISDDFKEKELNTLELKEYLSNTFPHYMIPTYFVRLSKFPLTTNGKINVRELPEPEIINEERYVAPRDYTEEKMVELWSDILHIEQYKISIDSNFFALGGHSLKATILVARIHKIFNVNVPLVEVFRNSTIMELSKYIKEASESLFESIMPARKKEYYSLSSAQKRLYILQQIEPLSTSYNLPMFLTIKGTLDESRLEQAFNKIIKRHESMRTSFLSVDGEIMQKIQPEVDFHFSYDTLHMNEFSEAEMKNILRNFIEPFDLSQSPLFRIKVLRTGNESSILMIDMHHIISDGVSLGILAEEIMMLYQGLELPELRLQYKDYAEWQNKMLSSNKIKMQEKFWLEQLAGELPRLNIPTDFIRPEIQSFEGSHIEFEIYAKLSQKLKDLARDEGVTVFMVILAAFNVLLSKLCGQNDIIIGTDTAGREHNELQSICGIFTNTLVLRNFVNSEMSFVNFLNSVKENLLDAFANQDYQFEMLVDKIIKKRDLSRNPIFDVMFSIHNEGPTTIDIDGVSFIPYELENGTSKFDFIIQGREVENRLKFNFEYNTRLFKRETIDKFAEFFIQIIEIVVQDKNIKLSKISIFNNIVLSNKSSILKKDEGDFVF